MIPKREQRAKYRAALRRAFVRASVPDAPKCREGLAPNASTARAGGALPGRAAVSANHTASGSPSIDRGDASSALRPGERSSPQHAVGVAPAVTASTPAYGTGRISQAFNAPGAEDLVTPSDGQTLAAKPPGETDSAPPPSDSSSLAASPPPPRKAQTQKGPQTVSPASSEAATDSTTPAAPPSAESNRAATTNARATTSGSSAPTVAAEKAPERSASPEIARSVTARKHEPGTKEPARTLVDGDEYYLGAMESDVIDAWREMRRQFGTNTRNKLRSRKAFGDWLQKKRRVSPGSVVWYGDFVAVRSCAARTRQPSEARSEEGWFFAVDPNRADYRDHHLFHEAFVAREALEPGPVADLVHVAWIPERVRQREASRLGKGDARPFVPGSIDNLADLEFVQGEVR